MSEASASVKTDAANYVESPHPPAFAEPLMAYFERRFGWTRNYSFGVLNGWFVSAGDGFLNAGLVLSSFAAALGAPNTVIALLPAITVGGWLLPQVAVAASIQHIRQKVIVYRAVNLIRSSAYGLIVLSCLLFAGQPQLLLIAFLIGLMTNSVASGVSGLPWMETVSKTIPPERRAGFFGTRNLYGGLLTLAAGFTVRALLASPLSFPFDYALIFALGGIFYSIGYRVFGFTEEPQDPPKPRGNIVPRATRPATHADRKPRVSPFRGLPRPLRRQYHRGRVFHRTRASQRRRGQGQHRHVLNRGRHHRAAQQLRLDQSGAGLRLETDHSHCLGRGHGRAARGGPDAARRGRVVRTGLHPATDRRGGLQPGETPITS